MSLSYTWQKLHAAVLILASGTGTIQERLCDAYVDSLIRLHDPNDFPLEMRKDFEAIQKELTAVPPSGNEGSAKASTNDMTDDKASEIAEKIVSMYDEITRMDEVSSNN